MSPGALSARLALWAQLIASEWRHQPGRVALALLALAVGVALSFAVFLVNASALAEFGQAVRSVNGQPDLELRPTAGDNADFDEMLFARVAAQPGVALASPVLEQMVTVRRQGVDAAAPLVLKLIGIDALSLARLAPDLIARVEPPATPLALLDPGLIFLNPAARRLLGEPAASTRLSLAGGAAGAATTSVDLLIGGWVSAAGAPLAVVDIASAQLALGRLGRLSRIAVQLDPGQDSAALLRALALPAEVRAAAPDEAEQRLSQLSRSYRVNLSVLALVALFTGAFLVYAVQALAVAKRVPQLALLGVLGMSAAERRALVLAEAGLLGGLGSLLGLGLGALMAQQALARLGGDLGSAGMLGGLFGSAGQPPPLQASLAATLAHGALGLAAALAGSWFPARAAERLAPAQSLKGAGAARVARQHTGRLDRLRPWAGPVMLVAGALLALLPPLPGLDGLPLAAYLSIALILLGGVVCVPALVELALARLRPSMAPLPLLVIERARDQRDSASATVAGVVASLALCVALTVMVASFRDSVAHWLDRVLPADLYVRSAGQRAGARVGPLPAGLTEAAAGLPGVAQVRPQRVTALQLDARQAAVALLSRPIDLQAGAAALAAELPLVGDALAARPGCINVAVSEALAALYDTRAGQVLALPLVFEARSRPADPGASAGHGAERAGHGSAGPNPAAGASSKRIDASGGQDTTKTGPCAAPRSGHVEVYIRAVWRDYARQQGAIVMDRHDWLALGGDGTANDLAIWLQPGASVSSVQATLRRLAAELQQAPVGPLPPALAASAAVAPATTTAPADALADENTSALEFATPGEIRALSLAIFDRSFVVTRWLQLVAIALGLVGVAASFSAQVLARRKEFGALQHLGMTRRQLLWLVAGEGALWCGLGALLGLALGLVISVILVHVVNPQSFHWSMELALPWPRLFALVATVLAAGSLAALLSGRAAASRQMALAVKEDW